MITEQVKQDGRRKNFFERKRFINYEVPGNEAVHSGQQRLTTSPEESQEESNTNASPVQEHPSKGLSKRHPLRNRRRFDNSEGSSKAPSHSPQPEFDVDQIMNPSMTQATQSSTAKKSPVRENNQAHN